MKFTLEKANVKGFCAFFRNNPPLVIAISIALFFTYGCKLFWYSIGIDTVPFMANRVEALKWEVQIGRFGLAALQGSRHFNPFFAFLLTFCLIWLFTLFWSYLIVIFCRSTGRNNQLIPFALTFMTSIFWAEQFYFLHQASEVALMITICPYVIYLFYKGFLDGERGKVISAFLLLVLMISVYQSMVLLFGCGVLLCFVLLAKQMECEVKEYWQLCMKFLAAMLLAVAVYWLINKTVLFVCHLKKVYYFGAMNHWQQRPFQENIFHILRLSYTITMGNIPMVQNATYYTFLHLAKPYAKAIKDAHSTIAPGTPFLPLISLLFIIKIIAYQKKESPGKKFLCIMTGIGIPFSIMIIPIIGGGVVPVRTIMALPLALAFMIFYLIHTYKKRCAIVITCLALFITVYQTRVTSHLFYSDQMRYGEDVRLANDLKHLIGQVQVDKKVPVVLFGNYKMSKCFRDDRNFLPGEAIGHSVFDFAANPIQTTENGLGFMKTLGIPFKLPNRDQLARATKESEAMPSYPDPNCVRLMEDYVVVKIAEGRTYLNPSAS
ncbi:MAG: glucosyltransferase domain-containing protein [Streptococcaceae bacterium]|jgi:hypothetical protein|nr:glucosyltransferase domain-containing protein [Streptococcaceae bacterium]